ncbi:YbaB/EbfC family nucleoid-associated protein [Nonomuraea sp. NPDC049400]|uniref:YbaB/EbfC family nucleoid-associated protein n=1 Tax=Nonomuraea sp. NPDC049400 TaxID=3364352 RepID=UPI0037A32374
MDFKDFGPDDLDRVILEAERSIRTLTDAIDELGAITGEGESRRGTVKARVDANGRLDDLKLAARASRMELDELTEEIVEAVRAAQDDQQRKATALIPQSLSMGISMEEIQSQFQDLQDSFSRDMHERLTNLDAIRRRAQSDD